MNSRITPSSSTPPPTVRDVAREAGVAYSTAAAALRGSPLVKQATREKIEQVASWMGYMRNQAASIMASQRQRKGQRLISVASLSCTLPREKRPMEWQAFDLLHAQAQDLGILHQHLNVKHLREARQVGRKLAAQGVDGLLIMRFEPLAAPPLLDLPWERFSVLTHYMEQMENGLDVLRPTNFQMTYKLCEGLKRHGYQRIGLIWRHHEPLTRNDIGVHAAFRSFQELQLPETRRLPLLRQALTMGSEDFDYQGWTERIARWIKTHQPEVLILFNRADLEVLWAAGYRVPQDVHVVHLHLGVAEMGRGEIAGFEASMLYGTRALLPMLLEKIRHRERGLREHPRETIMDLPFIPGRSLPGVAKL